METQGPSTRDATLSWYFLRTGYGADYLQGLARKMTQTMPRWAAPMQYGGRSGLSIEALHLKARMWQTHAKFQRQNLAMIFVDIKAAFYTIAKPLLCNQNLTQCDLEQFILTLGFPDSVMAPLLQHLQQSHLVYQCTGSKVATGSIAATGLLCQVVPRSWLHRQAVARVTPLQTFCSAWSWHIFYMK